MLIAYVDDNIEEHTKTLPLFFEAFQHFNLPVHRFDFFENGSAFLETWKPGMYDLIILDIFMGSVSGLDVANAIRQRDQSVRIAFCSSSNDFANESYDVNACYYLVKPVTEKQLNLLISRLNIEDYELRRFVYLPNGERLILRSMMYSEYRNHQVNIMLKSGNTMSLWTSQSDFIKLLKPYSFFVLCNRGSIVNMYEVKRFCADSFLMNNDQAIAISRSNRAYVKENYHVFLNHLAQSTQHIRN